MGSRGVVRDRIVTVTIDVDASDLGTRAVDIANVMEYNVRYESCP